MNKTTVSKMIFGAVLLLFTACTQDELAEQGCTLPDGEYPLQIGSVTLDVESSAEPCSEERSQTRVAENDNGTGSVWQWDGSEMIGVRLGDETTTYTLNADKTLTTDQQLYWTSAAPATVTAWYPTDESVDLSDQSEGLAYMLKAEVPGATYDNKITLSFKHQLAKVRVVLSGTQASLAQSVEVYGCTTCTNNEGAPVAGDTQGWLKMKHTTYTDGTECWEANVVPGTITLDNFVRINGQTATVNDGFPTTLSAGEMYTLNLTVGQPIKAGELAKAIGNRSDLTSIIVTSGTLNKADWDAIKQSKSLLVTIDLEGATYEGDDKDKWVYKIDSTMDGILETVKLPQGITALGEKAFSGCKVLTTVTLPETLTSIGNYAFNACYALTSITLPDKVTSIGECAFQSCDALTSIDLPDGVTSIGNYAFSGCSDLTSIDLPDKVTSIGECAFYDCDALKSIDLPDGLTSIRDMAFYHCDALETVICLATTPPTMDAMAFFECTNLKTIYVPASSVIDYKTAEGWFAYNIQAIQ